MVPPLTQRQPPGPGMAQLPTVQALQVFRQKRFFPSPLSLFYSACDWSKLKVQGALYSARTAV